MLIINVEQNGKTLYNLNTEADYLIQRVGQLGTKMDIKELPSSIGYIQDVRQIKKTEIRTQ